MKKVRIIILTALLMVLVIVGASCSTATTTPTATTSATAVKLVFTTQPVGGSAGSVLTTPPVVAIEDADGNIVTDYRTPVIISIKPDTGTGDVELFGGTTVIPVNGLATFTGLSINVAGTGYRLEATTSGLTPVVSDAFDITPGTAAKLVFTTQPEGVTAGSTFATAVSITDSHGNVVTTTTAPVTLHFIVGTVGLHTGNSTIAISGEMTANAINGIATFPNLSINMTGTGHKLIATSNGLTSGTSALFDVTAGIAVKLVFLVQPAGATANNAFTLQPVVWVEDANGNMCKSSSAAVPVTVSITPGTGTDGAVLSGTTTMIADNKGHFGVASFEGISIDLAGTGYTLTATTSGLTPAISEAFDVVTSAPLIKWSQR